MEAFLVPTSANRENIDVNIRHTWRISYRRLNYSDKKVLFLFLINLNKNNKYELQNFIISFYVIVADKL